MTAKSKKAPVAEDDAPDTAPASPAAEAPEVAPEPTPPEPSKETAEPDASPEPPPAPAAETPESGETDAEWERELTVYPLREGAADPRWAVRTVWGWTGFTLFCLAFVLALLVLGLFYD